MSEVNTFEFVGKLIPCKETDKFKPYETTWFKDSTWGNKSIKFNVACGNNRHLVELTALVNKDEKSMNIYSFTKKTKDESDNEIKGEKIIVPFADRFKPDIVASIADFKKYVVDTEVYGRRSKLEKAVDKFKDGSIDDEQMESLGAHNIEECETALAKSKEKRHEFISAYDMIDYLNKLVNSDKIKNMIFKVIGNFEFTYSAKKDIYYRHFTIQKIYRAEDDAEQLSSATVYMTYGREAVDTNDYEEKKKYNVNGYLSQYFSDIKGDGFVPITFIIDGNGDEKAAKRAEGFKKKFIFPNDYEGDYRHIGLIVRIFDGAQTVELTEDMLTDEQKENLEFGLITMDDIKKELGKPVYGDKVTDIVIDSLARGYSKGSTETVYTDKDFKKPIKSVAEDEAEDDDIFSDDIDI